MMPDTMFIMFWSKETCYPKKKRGGGERMELDTKKLVQKLFKLFFRRERARRDGESLKYSRNETRIIEVFGPF